MSAAALARTDPAAAALLADATAHLRGPLRVAVIGLDAAAVQRAARAAETPGVELVPIVVPTEHAIVPDPRWLRCHATAWVTGPPSPLGSHDRAAMQAVLAQGAPALRAVWLTELGLLAQIADDPAAEADAVRARVGAATDWPVTETPGAWLAGLAVDRPAREAEVAAFLCAGAARRCRAEGEEETAAADAIERLLAESDAKVEAAAERARRDAARVLGAARRHLESVRTDWDALVERLAVAIPAELDAVEDDAIDAHLGPWLDHVVQGWLRDRLAAYRAALLADLAETTDPEASACAAVAVPAVHAGVRAERDWARRLGVSAALGGSALLLFTPFWPAGVAGLAGTWWWTRSGPSVDRTARAEAAIKALHRVRRDTALRLDEQVDAVQHALDALAARRADVARSEIATTRARLAAEAAEHRARAARAHALADEVASGP